MPETVAVIGAGLVGSLMALGLAHQGYKVTLFELRPDPRLQNKGKTNLRSINLAVSERGIDAMKYVDEDMAKRVLDGVIPMYGRMIHDLQGNQESQIYGLFGESINSIDRSKLNDNLLNEIDSFNSKNSGLEIETKFENKLVSLDLSGIGATVITSSNGDELKSHFDFVIGADGSFSQVRQFLQKNIRMNYSQEFIDMCYLELYIPPGENNTFSIDPNHLHIWPRKNFMLIALPNSDGSFTSTFFGPWKFTESLNTREKIQELFINSFPDAVELIGMEKIVECFMSYPKGSLMQVNCNQYHYEDKCIIIGDAAHSMVPFYGQGMNCGFEDVRILLELMDVYHNSRKRAFESYSSDRAEDLKAILKLALDNYNEMSTKVTSSLYLLRKKLDYILGKCVPQYWIPLYTMVSFRSDINYSKAIRTEKRQRMILKSVEFSLLSFGLIGAAHLASRKLR
ncbi:hypothetical protein CANARDRAFT_5040 [[Candida] arabinofermentans NRRL YB-2248]|uniref:Kynurenine 3-monooxygenase n=1 Tax=[Candida] arabinofermentans NRRL YB-2248 TaxID=983967 RepID=A0A1E4T7J0_9ASCO|nr:hypothetical protein CANARDRAFT_5040 [[Candida] arabinofermentans NRRL YB-2248]